MIKKPVLASAEKVTSHHNHPVHHHAHHFESAKAEFNASKQGMWIFLVTELLMFGGLFVGYGILRGLYPEMFHEAHQTLNVTLGSINTVILITSSLTMMLAVTSAQKNQKNKSIGFLAITIAFALGFLVIKFFEYQHKFHEGLLPGGHFHHPEIKDPKAPLFFSIYFMTTGLHGVHVILGIGLMTWLIIRSLKGEFSSKFFTPVELVGFYWHFVDLVWIYLFPLLYLVG